MTMNQIDQASTGTTPTDPTLSLVLFSGTDDKLTAAAVMAVGAAAMGRPVHVFLQYWGLEAFRADSVRKDHGTAAEAGTEEQQLVREAIERGATQHWSELFGQAKELGDVTIQACALSMEILSLKKDELDGLVDGIEGVAAFMLAADGPIVFI